MLALDFPIGIRDAKLDEFAIIGRLHWSAMASDAARQLIHVNVDYSEWLHWTWKGAEAIAPVTAGHEKVLVIERSDKGEVMGFTKYRHYSKAYPPTLPKSFPRGFKEDEYARLTIPGQEWQKIVLEQYGEFLHVQTFAMAPAYQSRGLGRALMLKVISHAQQRGLNITLSAASGKTGFYTKFGFHQSERPIMLADGKAEGGNMMLLKNVSSDLI